MRGFHGNMSAGRRGFVHGARVACTTVGNGGNNDRTGKCTYEHDVFGIGKSDNSCGHIQEKKTLWYEIETLEIYK